MIPIGQEKKTAVHKLYRHFLWNPNVKHLLNIGILYFLKKKHMDKMKILVVYADTQGGVGFYRSTQPHEYLAKHFPDEFEVEFTTSPNFSDKEYFKKFDLVHIHKALFSDMRGFYDMMKFLKENHIATVMDIDDSWDLSPTHPLYASQKEYHLDDLVKKNLTLFDYVTTTTPIFAKEIEPFNKNTFILPNAIDTEDQRFKLNKKPYKKVRVGFVMGSAHEADVRQMGNFISKIPKETLDKMQIVLCGYDLRGTMRIIDQKTKQVQERPIQPKETTWFKYENMITNDRKILSEKYRKFLNMYVPNLEYPYVDDEPYRRCWTKDMAHYYTHFENIDILYAPLEVKHFNYVKSQLKAIECCFSDTALIAQNYGPYTIDLKHALDENGNYNGGNALLVNTDEHAEKWAEYTELLVNNPELLRKLKNQIHEDLKDKYSLDVVTKTRAEFYKRLINEKKG